MEKTLLQREMDVLKKLAVQSDQMAKRNEVLEEAVRGREARIHQLEQQVLDKTQQIDQFRDDLQDFRHKTETLADELQRAREDDVHGQLGKYEKELQLSRKAYEEIKNASSIRIDLLEHKLAVANNELQKHIE
jgi:chromosome segregation ATPase